MNLFKLALISLFLFSCKPEQAGVEFSVTIKPQAGEDAKSSTREDTPLLVKYEIEKGADSVDLSVAMVQRPQFGTLKDCKMIANTQWQCIYIPNKDFSGVDTLKFRTKDGDFTSDDFATLEIQIFPVPDNPVADSGQNLKLPENDLFSFDILPGSDVDSDVLTYELVDSPEFGTLSNCASGESSLKCDYTPNNDFVGEDSFSYKVIDSDGLESKTNTIVKLNVLNYPEIGADKVVEVAENAFTHTFTVNPVKV